MHITDELKKGIACDSIGTPDSVLGRTACVMAHPGKMALFPFFRWFEKKYAGKYRFARVVFSVDLLLIGIALGLGVTALVFALYKPVDFGDKIFFDAVVAPREVVAGAPSTLIIRYTNGTGEELRNARLTLGFPAHFLLQELSLDEQPSSDAAFDLGTLPPNATGSVRIRGVMFGDVGGKQTFRSIMTFTHGERDAVGQKIDFQTFSPVRSTLSIELDLPERLVAFQPVAGSIRYRNTGEIDFPEISIEPEWPTGFTFQKADVPLKDGAFQLEAVAPGKEGVLHFEGIVGDISEAVTFIFHPSFTFGAERYRQETLVHASPVIPPQLKVSHSLEAETLRPGGNATVTVAYENTGEFPVRNAKIGFESDSPFFKQKTYTVDATTNAELREIAPGVSGTVTVTAPLRAAIQQSETTVYENIQVTTRAFASYTLDDGSNQAVSSRGTPISSTLVTPLVLDSFGRYTAPSGDQLGRGPLPPLVGEETKYWIFWNVRGTTNTITNVRIEGDLAPNARFTGRQTVSQMAGVNYDPTEHAISWVADAITPTLAPGSKIVGIGFEVGITPTIDQVGTSPALIRNVRVTATDATTGAFISANGASVTTSLPNDSLAAGKAVVETF